MAVKKRLYKSRLEQAIEELDNSVYVVEVDGKKVNDQRNNNYPLNHIRNVLDEGVKDVRVRSSSNNNKRTWVDKAAFDDGYDFGDITKTLLGTSQNITENLFEGAIGIGEKAIDLGAYAVGGIGGALGNKDLQDSMSDFIKKDLINEEKLSKYAAWTNPTALVNYIVTGGEVDENSLLGDKTESLIQSGGQLAATAGLQAVGVPWWLTTGATSFGGATEEALNSGASYGEAGAYGLISAGAEMLTEKLSGGISFGGKTLDDTILKPLTNKITNKTLNALVNFGLDATGEGTEEVLTEIITNVGKKLTYEDEKTWGELLTSEEAMDTYLESFIGGAALGGVANTGRTVNSIKTGRDYKTGYTQNEQSVIDKEVQNRIGDKKLSNKEISKIKEEVETDFKKGYISTDTIESVLGGKEYESYKSVLDKQAELDKINNTKKSEIETLGDEDALRARKKALEEELSKTDINTLRDDLNVAMGDRIKSDDFLKQSYLEQSKKGQSFTYDKAKVKNDFEKVALESASRVMNDTRRSHEFVEPIVKMAKEKGTYYEFTNNEELSKTKYNVKGKTVNGLTVVESDGKTKVLINVDSNKALNAVVGHETTHLLEGTKEYKELQKAIFEFAKQKGDYDSRVEKLKSLYNDIEGADIDSELTADLVGDYLFTDTDFVNNLSTQKPTVFQKIKELIDDLVVRFKGTKEEKALREVQKKFKEAYRQTGTQTDTKYSLESDSRDYAKEIAKSFKGKNEISLNEIMDKANEYAFGELDTEYDYTQQDNTVDEEFADNIIEKVKFELDKIGYHLDEDTDMFTKVNENVDNLNPTDNPDVRYSLSDNQEERISKLQNEYEALDKTRDVTFDERDTLREELNKLIRSEEYKNASSKFMEMVKSGISPNEISKTQEYQLMAEEEKIRKKLKEYDADIKVMTEDMTRISEMIENEEKSHRNPKDAINQAKEFFGITNDFREAGYLLQDGTLLDFSGRSQGSRTYGRRTLDHREINEVGYDMDEFIELGNIRMKPESSGFELSKPLTKEQKSIIRDYLNTLDDDIMIDITKEGKVLYDSAVFKKGTPSSKIFNDLDYYFENGKFPKQSEFAEFRYSLSKENDIAPRNPNLTYGEDIKLQVEEAIAPLQEEIKQLKESLQTTVDEYKPITEEDLPMFEAQNREAFNNIDESYAPIETEDNTPHQEITPTKSLFETRSYEEVGSKKINAYQYDNPEVKPYFQEEAKNMLSDLQNSTKGERFYNDELYYESSGEQGFSGVSRHTTQDIAELLDGVDGKYKYTYAEIEKGLKAIINDEGSENNAVSKRIEFYLDQRLRNGYTDVLGYDIPANQEYIDTLTAKEMNDYYSSLPIDDSMIPSEYVSDSELPIKKLDKTTPRTTEASEPKGINKAYQLTIDGKAEKIIDNSTYNQVAEILTEEPKTESDRNKRKWAIFKANILDKGMVFEDLSLKNNNRELIAKWDYTLSSGARGQYAIGNGYNGTKSLDAIRQQVDNTGLTKEFYEYMYHKHNVDRMTLDKRFQTENKPVFGESVTSEVSQAKVNHYEAQHPEFMDYAQDVYNYLNAERQLLVDNGVISQEVADLWNKMYPHYVPTRRTTDTGLDVNVPLDTGRTGINAPIKKATGGSADILPLFDTMAMRTLQTHKATAKNSFGVELKNTLGTSLETNQINVDEVIDSIDSQDGLLQEGVKGKNPTFTVFENGEKITFEITKDMYDALKPVSESSMLSKTSKALNIAGNIRRGLLTEYNPTFMLTNAIKDVQDILINSQHATKTYTKIPEAYKQIAQKGYWYQEYIKNGGEQNSYFDNETNTFKTENKGIDKILNSPPLSTISKINNFIEMAPRLAEYIASREAGRSVEVSMLDAARVTTNFKAGGDVTKWANRNGATFLNASVQGAMQQVRNIREANANGFRGYVNLATKFAIASLPAVLLNNLVWEDDEEYEELSDYVKQNYYVVAKDDDGTFIRIPKGRTVAVIQEAFNQMENLVTGDDEADLKSFIDLTINNLAPNNPLDNNIFSPIVQVATNEAWYGGDLVPTRLQDLPAAEQYDESTDKFSRWIGETFNVSPYKVNYLLDQYSGGVGDVVLPMITPEANNDAETLGEYLIAPFKSKFSTNSTMNNQNISDFYDTSEELITNAKKSNATDKDVLSNKYINSVKAEMNELYKEKREIQNSDLSKSEKYEKVLDIQSQINDLAENALSEYNSVNTSSNYSTVGDREYYKKINEEGQVEWTKVKEEEAEDLNNLGLSRAEKNTYFSIKSDISSIISDYKDNKSALSGIDEDSDEYKEAAEQLSSEKKVDIINKIKDTGFSDEQKAYLYKKYYNSDTIDTIVRSGISVDTYLDYATKEFESDKDRSGKTISGSRKKKVIKYVNSLDLSIAEKAILIKSTNTFKFNEYNKQIVQYVGNLDIPYEEKVSLLEELDMKVYSDGTVRWE